MTVVNGWRSFSEFCREVRRVAAGGLGRPESTRLTRGSRFPIYSGSSARDVAMKGSTTSAAIHPNEGQPARAAIPGLVRGRWWVVTHGTCRHGSVMHPLLASFPASPVRLSCSRSVKRSQALRGRNLTRDSRTWAEAVAPRPRSRRRPGVFGSAPKLLLSSHASKNPCRVSGNPSGSGRHFVPPSIPLPGPQHGEHGTQQPPRDGHDRFLRSGTL